MTDISVRRRDWIHIAALGTAGVGGSSVLFPLITQMAPTADVLAASTTDCDVSAIEAGQSIKATFRDQPLFIKRLTDAESQKRKRTMARQCLTLKRLASAPKRAMKAC